MFRALKYGSLQQIGNFADKRLINYEFLKSHKLNKQNNGNIDLKIEF